MARKEVVSGKAKAKPSRAARIRAAEKAMQRGKVDPFSPNVRSTRQMADNPASGLSKIFNGKGAAPAKGVRSTVGDYAAQRGIKGVGNTSGANIMKILQAQVAKQNLGKGLSGSKVPNTKGGAPGVLSPGSAGLPTNSGTSLSAPKINTKLNVNTKGVQKRAVNAAGIEYDPQIAAIRNMITSTDKRGKANITDAGNMYSALEKSIRGDLPGITQAYDSGQARTDKTFQDLQDSVNNRYNGGINAQTAALNQMGLQQSTSGPNAVQNGQISDQNFLQGIIGNNRAVAADMGEKQQLAAEDFTRGTATRAAAQGATTKTQLMTDLADKILKLQTDKGSLTSAKAKAIRELTDQYKQEATAQAERDRAFNFDVSQFNYGVQKDQVSLADSRAQAAAANEVSQARVAVDAQKAKNDANKQNAADFKSLDPYERAGAKAQQLIGKDGGSRAISYLENLIRGNRNIQNGYVSVNQNGKTVRVPITAERFSTIAANNAAIAGLPKNSIQKIAAILWKEMH